MNQNHLLCFHKLGTAQADDVLVYQRPDQPEWYLGGSVTEDGRWLVIYGSKGTNPESSVFLKDLTRLGAPVEPFLDRMDASYTVVDSEGDRFFVLTNQAAPRNRLVAIQRGHAEPSAWTSLIPQAKGGDVLEACLLYTSPSPRDRTRSRMPSSA